jgi:hypothetical protein
MGGVHELDGTGKEESISIPSSGFYGQKSKLTGYQTIFQPIVTLFLACAVKRILLYKPRRRFHYTTRTDRYGISLVKRGQEIRSLAL